jgi:CheY-like chemotaxis protein
MVRKARILIVDDDERLLKALKRWLGKGKNGLTVFTAANAQDALNLSEREWLHLALIDVKLSDDPDDRGGFDLARKMWPGIPKIYLTVLEDGDSSRTGLSEEMKDESNVVGYILKRDGEQRILEGIEKVLRKLNLDLTIRWGNFSSLMLVEMLKGYRGKSDREKKVIAEELDDLFCKSFKRAKTIEVIELKRGKGGCAVARLRPTMADGKVPDVMVKFGPRQTILEEWKNYQDWVEEWLPFGRTAVNGQPAETLHLAAIKYTFVGGSGVRGSFKDFYRDAPSEQIDRLLSNIFLEISHEWYGAMRAPKDDEDMPLDTWYRGEKSLNLADAKHVAELEAMVAQLLRSEGNIYALNVQRQGEIHVKVNLGQISELLPNPLNFALPEHSSNGAGQNGFPHPTWMAITHGDLNGDNILVSKENTSFLIDFYKTGFSPVFRDFVALESIIKFELLHSSNLVHRYQFESDLLAPFNFSDPIPVSNESDRDPDIKKALIAVQRLRQLAFEVTLSNDMHEYYVGLLFYALKEIVGFSSGSDEPSCCDVRQYHAFLSAAKICEKLLNRQINATTPAAPIKVFLNYAREDNPAVKEIYRKLVSEGFNPWMDTENIIGGEHFEWAIQKALKDAHLIIPVLTKTSVRKRGFRQKEIKWALDRSLEKMAGDIHIIPLRLDRDCDIPEELEHLQCIDFYEEDGWDRLTIAIREGIKRLES